MIRKGLTIGERQIVKKLRRELMAIRHDIRLHGTSSEKVLGLTPIPIGTIEWHIVYSIRGQNEGINGILKKRGDLIGDGQHTTWLLGNPILSNHLSMDLVGVKIISYAKFIMTGQKKHHLRAIHNWKRDKFFILVFILVIFCRKNSKNNQLV